MKYKVKESNINIWGFIKVINGKGSIIIRRKR